MVEFEVSSEAGPDARYSSRFLAGRVQDKARERIFLLQQMRDQGIPVAESPDGYGMLLEAVVLQQALPGSEQTSGSEVIVGLGQKGLLPEHTKTFAEVQSNFLSRQHTVTSEPIQSQ